MHWEVVEKKTYEIIIPEIIQLVGIIEQILRLHTNRNLTNNQK